MFLSVALNLSIILQNWNLIWEQFIEAGLKLFYFNILKQLL